MGGDGPQDTACRGNAHFCEPASHSFLQLPLHFTDRISHFVDIMDLSVQHRSRFMFLHPLGNHHKLISALVPHRPHNASGSNVKPEYQLSCIFSSFHYRRPPNFLSICLYASVRLSLLSMTKQQFFLNISSLSWDFIMASVFSSV